MIDVSNFEEQVLAASHEKPILVDFWAPWCGPCRVLGPIIEGVAAEYDGDIALVKLNTDENPQTAMQYRIEGIPAVKAFVDGRVAAEFTGAVPETQVRAFFQRLAPDPAARAAQEASELAAHDPAEAERRYREILATAPNNADAIIGLAEILLDHPLELGGTGHALLGWSHLGGDEQAVGVRRQRLADQLVRAAERSELSRGAALRRHARVERRGVDVVDAELHRTPQQPDRAVPVGRRVPAAQQPLGPEADPVDCRVTQASPRHGPKPTFRAAREG